MPEMSKEFIPEFMGDPKPREKILALGKKITDVLPHKLKGLTTNDPEYWGLACIVSDDMADIALKMDVRHPYTYEELKELVQPTDVEKFDKNLAEMARIGIVEYDYSNLFDHDGSIEGERVRRYILPMFVPGSAEFTNMVKKQLDDHPELAMFFERMTFIPLKNVTALVPPGGAGIGMHVIPVEEAIPSDNPSNPKVINMDKSIKMENQSLDIEHISYWLKKYEGHIGVGMCSCRYGRSKLNEGCGDDANEWCISVGDMTEYLAETDKGRAITYDEAISILKKAEANGYVHQITNIDGENKIFAICNCNVNICNALRTSQLFNTPNMSRSAYTAKVDPKNCVACGGCVEKCPAGAVKLGQKLCLKTGPVVYPKHELPDHMSWGEDKWDEDYREHNRINCYDTGTAPCKTACPAHIAIQGYLKKAKEGKYDQALAIIKKENPFPAVCGRVCNKRCEDACTRGLIDSPVAIDDVKKFIAERDLRAETRYIPAKVIPSSVKDHFDEKIAIIGGGPAGLSCAYYLALKGYLPTVFEKNEKAGGMMMYGIPSYKLEKDVIDAEIDVLKALGVEIKTGVEVGKDVTIKELREQGYKGFYLAIGCQGGRLPHVSGEDGKNTFIAVDFLRDILGGKVTHIDGDVVVIGGGNVAIDCVRSAKRLTSGNVTMVCLEDKDHMVASKVEIVETLEEHIEIKNSYGPKEIIRNEDGTVKEVVFKKCLRTIDPETKRFDPLYDENDTISIKADNIVYAIGQQIKWDGLLKDTSFEFVHGNYPKADPLTFQTSEKDIFVGGDVYYGPKFIIDAIESGKKAAESLHRYVQPGTSLTIGRDKREFIEFDKKNAIFPEDYNHASRQVPAVDTTIDGHASFKDNRLCLSEEQIKVETSRCLSCGAAVVDENKCIGCGVCTTRCKFDAIHLFRDHPESSTMVKSEDKFKAILPYAIKRGIKIKFGKKTEAEKISEKKHKEYKKQQKAKKKALKANA